MQPFVNVILVVFGDDVVYGIIFRTETVGKDAIFGFVKECVYFLRDVLIPGEGRRGLKQRVVKMTMNGFGMMDIVFR